MIRHLIIYISIVLGFQIPTLANNIDSLLNVLDQTLKERPQYETDKEERISSLRFESKWVADGQPRLEVLGRLLDEFNLYNCDSALAVCQERAEISKRMGLQELILENELRTAYSLSIAGMYKEAVDIIEGINLKQVPANLRLLYFQVSRSLYGQLEDYSVRAQEKEKYGQLTMIYRDSLADNTTKGSIQHALILADKSNVLNEPKKAIKILNDALGDINIQPLHIMAISAYTLSESYRLLDDKDNQEYYLILSAIADMKDGSREYISLRKLALLLYEEGNIERSSFYLRQCMDDAQKCQARFRMLETDDIFNAVNNVYLSKIDSQKSHLRWLLLGVFFLVLLLVWAILLIVRGMRKVEQSNTKLKLANDSIAETSSLKEEYIAQYMDQCSTYIDKLDQQRKTLSKIAKGGTMEDLKKYNKSLIKIDEEIRQFYANFDSAFLKIFPTFVEDFNSLLRHDERLYPKKTGELSPELRIFALIRLGITDSTKIARFLRYSLPTIYSYRTRVRNRAIGDRETLEIDMMRIGRTK